NLLQQLVPLTDHGGVVVAEACHIAAGLDKARYETIADRVRDGHEYDWNRPGRLLLSPPRRGTAGQDHITAEAHQLGHGRLIPIEISPSPAIVKSNIVAFYPTQLAQSFLE